MAGVNYVESLRNAALPAGLFLIVAFGATAIGFAATPNDASKIADMLACRDLRDDAARLSCFDRTGALLPKGDLGKSATVVVTKEDTRRKNAPKVDRAPIVNAMATITSVATLAYDRYLIRLDSGVAFRTTEAWIGAAEPRTGGKVRITKSPLGGYLLGIGGRSIHANQVD